LLYTSKVAYAFKPRNLSTPFWEFHEYNIISEKPLTLREYPFYSLLGVSVVAGVGVEELEKLIRAFYSLLGVSRSWRECLV
jgi:hypothetical protein